MSSNQVTNEVPTSDTFVKEAEKVLHKAKNQRKDKKFKIIQINKDTWKEIEVK